MIRNPIKTQRQVRKKMEEKERKQEGEGKEVEREGKREGEEKEGKCERWSTGIRGGEENVIEDEYH